MLPLQVVSYFYCFTSYYYLKKKKKNKKDTAVTKSQLFHKGKVLNYFSSKESNNCCERFSGIIIYIWSAILLPHFKACILQPLFVYFFWSKRLLTRNLSVRYYKKLFGILLKPVWKPYCPKKFDYVINLSIITSDEENLCI